VIVLRQRLARPHRWRSPSGNRRRPDREHQLADRAGRISRRDSGPQTTPSHDAASSENLGRSHRLRGPPASDNVGERHPHRQRPAGSSGSRACSWPAAPAQAATNNASPGNGAVPDPKRLIAAPRCPVPADARARTRDRGSTRVHARAPRSLRAASIQLSQMDRSTMLDRTLGDFRCRPIDLRSACQPRTAVCSKDGE
jgi:hypothetical protein